MPYSLSGYVVSSGVTLDVGPDSYLAENGGDVVNVTVGSGGVIKVSNTGIATGTTIGSGGTFILSGGLTSGTAVDSGTLVSGGVEVITGGSVVNATVISAGTLLLSTEGDGITVGAGGVESSPHSSPAADQGQFRATAAASR